jgi:receptor protein-tyrosine kinase
MGRIAEALKRAEQERAWHLDSETPGAPGAGPAVNDQFSDPAFLADPDLIARAPEPPRPLLTNVAPITPDSVQRAVVALHQPGCQASERFRAARTRLLTSNPDGSSRLHAITSSAPGEGKSVTAANLAFSMAELRHLRVALIDLDFRQRGLDRLFGAANQPGVAEVLRGEHTLSEVCVPLVRPNLHYVPAGILGDQTPSELLSSQRVGVLFREISERFHYGLIDTPPSDTVADVGLIAPLCHSAIFVIRMNSTPEPLVRRCVRMLQANGVLISGSILVGGCDDTTEAAGPHGYLQPTRGEA